MLVEQQKMNKREVIVVSSLDVAETFKKEHSHVLRDIRELECSEEFRQSNFGLSSYKSEQNKELPMYYITRVGFTLLAMGYTGEKAMRFKEAYIRQFNEMENMLTSRLIEREKGIVIRQAFTRAIKEAGENERLHGHGYSLYTDMVYRFLYGKSAKELREDKGLSKTDDLRDYFSKEELSTIISLENMISGFVSFGYGYDEIKHIIEPMRGRIKGKMIEMV